MRSISFILETAVEVIGLVFWFNLQRMADLTSIYLGAILLLVLLLAEHVISQVAYTGVRVSAQEGVRIFGFTLFEVIVWVAWLQLIDIGQPIAAVVFFFVFLYVEHQITYNTKKTREEIRYLNFTNRHLASPASRLRVFVGLVLFTISEVAGAGVWVTLVDAGNPLYQGLIALIVGSLIEHFIAGKVAHIT